MDITIRRGTPQDLDGLEALYNDLNDHLAATTNYPGWQKGVYPARRDAAEGIEQGCLYLALQGERPVGSMILRHSQEAAYSTATWQASLTDSQVLVVYTFAIHPRCHRMGIAQKMLDYAYEQAAREKVRALRLDVYEKNLPAIRLYEKCGYQYIGTVSLGLEECGLNGFKLYERLL